MERICTCKVSYEEELLIKLDIEGWPDTDIHSCSGLRLVLRWALWEQFAHRYGNRKVWPVQMQRNS